MTDLPVSQRARSSGCPFCGATPHHGLGKVQHCQLHGEPFQDFSIWCPSGHAKITARTEERAREMWEARATVSRKGGGRRRTMPTLAASGPLMEAVTNILSGDNVAGGVTRPIDGERWVICKFRQYEQDLRISRERGRKDAPAPADTKAEAEVLREVVGEAVALIDEINERKSSREFYDINQVLHAKIATIRATLTRAALNQGRQVS